MYPSVKQIKAALSLFKANPKDDGLNAKIIEFHSDLEDERNRGQASMSEEQATRYKLPGEYEALYQELRAARPV